MSVSETIAIVNARAGGGTVLERWRRYGSIIEARLGRAHVIETESTHDAIDRTRAALREGARTVIAVGGDGTVNGVANGFFDAATCEPIAADAVLGVLPIGTGNDFARSIGLYGTDLGAAFAASEVRRIDVGVLDVTGRDGRPIRRVFVNTASFGMSARIAADVGGSAKRLGGRLSYWVGTARALLTERATSVRMSLDGEVTASVVNMVGIGNGRYVGGGMKIAPEARLDDGRLDVIVIDAVGLAQFLRHSGRLYAGTHVELPFVHVSRVHTLRAESAGSGGREILADVEGEPVGVLPLACEVRASALPVLAPWTRAEAVGGSADARDRV